MLEMFRNSITDEEMYGLCRVLYERAITGDMSALKMVWQYKLGKPLPAPHPDRIDRDEWDHFQKDAMTLDEMKKVLGQLPSRIGNAIVSAALPSIASTISHTLAQQLLQGLPAEYLADQSTGPVNEEPNPPAGSNGFLPAEPAGESPSPATLHTPLATHPSSGSNGFLPAAPAGESPSPATLHTPLATHPSSGSNGFLPALDEDGLPVRTLHHTPSSSKANRVRTAQPNEQAPVPSSLSTRHTPLAAIPSSVSNGVLAAQPGGEAPAPSSRAPRPSSPATPSSLSTRHVLRAAHSSPIANGKSKAGGKKKKARKSLKNQWLDPIAKKCQASKKHQRQRVSA
jgi:hypothetical protein